MPGGLDVHVSPQLLVELGLRGRGYHAVGHDLGAETEAFVEDLPHGSQRSRTQDERRAVGRVAHSQLPQQFRADECLAQAHDVADVAAAVGFDHGQAAAHGIKLEVGQLLSTRRDRQRAAADFCVVELVEGLQIDVIRWCLRQRPRPLQLRHQRPADVLRVVPQGVKPVPQRQHFGVAGDPYVQLGVAREPSQRQV